MLKKTAYPIDPTITMFYSERNRRAFFQGGVSYQRKTIRQVRATRLRTGNSSISFPNKFRTNKRNKQRTGHARKARGGESPPFSDRQKHFCSEKEKETTQSRKLSQRFSSLFLLQRVIIAKSAYSYRLKLAREDGA